MSKEPAPGAFQQNKWLLAITVVLAAVGVVGYVTQPDTPPEDAANAASELSPENQRLRDALNKSTARAQEEQVDPTVRMRSAIEEHRVAIESSPDPAESAARLMAMGNLHLQLMEFEQAATAFEQVVIDHKGWEGARGAYPQLLVCYEQLHDTEGIRWTYQQMMNDFPPDTQEHILAKDALGL